MPKSNTKIIWTSIFEWYVVMCKVENLSMIISLGLRSIPIRLDFHKRHRILIRETVNDQT